MIIVVVLTINDLTLLPGISKVYTPIAVMILSLELRKGRVGGGKDLLDPLHLGEEVILETYS